MFVPLWLLIILSVPFILYGIFCLMQVIAIYAEWERERVNNKIKKQYIKDRVNLRNQ